MGFWLVMATNPFFSNFPSWVLETPVSELSFTGMAVGLASQGFRPMVDHGRIALNTCS